MPRVFCSNLLQFIENMFMFIKMNMKMSMKMNMKVNMKMNMKCSQLQNPTSTAIST